MRQPYNKEAFKNTLKKIWHIEKLVLFHELGFGLLMVEFEENLEKGRVLRESPWIFHRNLILLKEFDEMLQVKHFCIIETSFWV